MIKQVENIDYIINGATHRFECPLSNEFQYGKDECLSNKDSDITFHQSWYEQGFTIENIFSDTEFDDLKRGLTNSIAKIISEQTHFNVPDNFKLEDYHSFISDNESHLKIVSKTRDLFAGDFNFPIYKCISRFEDILNIKLSDFSEELNIKMHVIIRINRPLSADFNPPHKDIYEGYDALGFSPKFVNIWIPIAGATSKSNLPIVRKSHLIKESKILRTFKGGQIGDNQYRVRIIKSWDKKNELERSTVGYGQALIFSPHLIHGLALNLEENKTRVALEFRLFKK